MYFFKTFGDVNDFVMFFCLDEWLASTERTAHYSALNVCMSPAMMDG